jgi:uncharacterized protein (TIGR03437 family)
VDYLAPATLALGAATVTVKSGDGSQHSGAVTIADVQPALFTLNSTGLIAGSILRSTSTGKLFQSVYTLDVAGNAVAAPVDLSKDQVSLIFYATGIRRAPLGQVSVSIGGASVPVVSSGAQGSSPGLDQVSVQLPSSLAGSGDVPVTLTVAGKPANMARMTIK